MTRFHAVGLLIAAFAAIVLAGCEANPQSVQDRMIGVRGKVVNAGQPLKVSNPMAGWVEIKFIEYTEPGSQKAAETYTARADQNGEFDAAGKFPGKYKIAVRQWDPYPNTDLLEGKFDEANTTIVRDVKAGDNLVIDVSKPEG